MLGGLLLATALALPAAAWAQPAAPMEAIGQLTRVGDPPVGLSPSVHYEEAMAHADDPNSFTLGSRVRVPFLARPTDRFPVGASRPGAVQNPEPSVRARSLRRQVFGFLPYWELSDSSTRIDPNLLSTIAYFGVGADALGNLIKRTASGALTTGWAGWTSSRLTEIIEDAHRAGTRVVLTVEVFAWTSSQASRQRALLASPEARLNLARQAAAAVRDRGADGINLDFEPIVVGQERGFVALVRTVRAELNRLGRGYELTFDTTGRIGNYPIEDALAAGAADAVFVMGYDYRTAGSAFAGSISPLSGPSYDLTDTIRAYVARVPASKIILGVPYYGRAWATVSDRINARTQTGARYGYSASVPYGTAVQLGSQHGRRWDPREQTAWTAYRRQSCTATYGCQTSWRQLYYDDHVALKAKYDTINRFGLRGSGIWALGYEDGRAELQQAIIDKFVLDTTPPEAGIRLLASSQRDEGFIVSWTARDDFSSVAAYDVEVSIDGGAWKRWLSGSRADSAVYPGRDGHGYAFRVRARDRKGNLGPWDVRSVYVAEPTLRRGGFARAAIDGLNVRAGAYTSATRLTTIDAGTTVAITGGPVDSDGYTWYEVTVPITEWNVVGDVDIGVWVAGSSATTEFLLPARPPNSTLVTAGLRRYRFDDGAPDSVGPAGAVKRSFSPNGDESRDRLAIRWNNRHDFDSISLRVFRADGQLLGTIDLPDVAAGDQAHAFDGLVGGQRLGEGAYILQLVATRGSIGYRAPSSRPVSAAQLAAYGVVVDLTPPAITSAAITGRAFSPDGDRRLDSLAVRATARGAHRWMVTVAPRAAGAAAEPVRILAGRGVVANAVWDGRTAGGAGAPDGDYRIRLILLDAAGNSASRSWDVRLDRRDPLVSLSAVPDHLSPNGDRADDRGVVRWTADEPVSGWLSIRRDGRVLRRWVIRGGSGSGVVFDGRDGRGRLLAEGRYQVLLDVADSAANRVRRARWVTIDRTAGYLRWSAGAFLAADRDSLSATSRLSVRLTRPATTRLAIYDGAGRVVRRGWSDRRTPAGLVAWTWDGRTGNGRWAPSGRYMAVFVARTALGTTVLRREVIVGAFYGPPPVVGADAGGTLTVTFATVEPLRGAPAVTLRRPGGNSVTITARPLGGGRYRATFLAGTATGSGSLTISGRDVGGGLNVSAFSVEIH